MRVFAVGIEFALDVPVKRLQHADARVHHEVPAFGGALATAAIPGMVTFGQIAGFGALVALSGVAQLQLTVHKVGLRICEPHFTHNGSHAFEWARDSVSAGDNNLVARLKIRGTQQCGWLLKSTLPYGA
jgi:hypothetical protein